MLRISKSVSRFWRMGSIAFMWMFGVPWGKHGIDFRKLGRNERSVVLLLMADFQTPVFRRLPVELPIMRSKKP